MCHLKSKSRKQLWPCINIDPKHDLYECQILRNEEKIWRSSRHAVLVIRAEMIITHYRSQSRGPVVQGLTNKLFTSLPYELAQTRLAHGHHLQSLPYISSKQRRNKLHMHQELKLRKPRGRQRRGLFNWNNELSRFVQTVAGMVFIRLFPS